MPNTPPEVPTPTPLLTRPEPAATVRLQNSAQRVPPKLPAWYEQYPVIPGYEIVVELGRGGMGVVYEAVQRTLNRRVALKMIRSTAGICSSDVARFLAEAEVLASVRHPNVVQVFECGTSEPGLNPGDRDGFPFMALELVSGGTLARLVFEQGQLDPQTAAELLASVADGVQAVHDAGIVHRDLKPANILLEMRRDSNDPGTGPTVVPKVTDFGVARRGGSDLTATGMAVGTPEYMAPEQAAGHSKFVGPAADVWALGIILYEVLTGETPFRGGDVWSVVQKVLSGSVPALRRRSPHVPRDLELICHKCLEKEPHHRYASAAEFAADLRRFLAGKPVTVRPLGPMSRVWRAGRRNPAVASLIGAVVLSSTIGAIASFHQAAEARQSASWANAEAKRANAEAERARIEESNATREASNARLALLSMQREETARKAADVFSLRAARAALYSRELGDAWRALAAGDVPGTEQTLSAASDFNGWEVDLLKRWFARSSPVLPPVPGQFMPLRLVVSPDSRWVVAAGMPAQPDGPPVFGAHFLCIWDLERGGVPVQVKGKYALPVRTLAFDSTAKRFVAASDDCVRVWAITDLSRPELEVRLLPESQVVPQTPPPRLAGARITDECVSAVIAPYGGKTPAKLVTWAINGVAKPIEAEIPGSNGTTVAAFARDGKSLLLAGGEGTGFVKRITIDGKVLGGPLTFGGTPVTVGLALDDVGAIVGTVTSISGCELISWDGTATKLARRAAFKGYLGTVEVRPDGRALASANPNMLWVWDPATGTTETPAVFSHFGGAASFPDSRRFVVGEYQSGVRIWNPVPAHEVAFAHPQEFPVSACSGDRVLVVIGHTIRVMNQTSEQGGSVDHTPGGPNGGLSAAAWCGDWIALVVEGADRTRSVVLYDPATKLVTRRWAIHPDSPSALAATSDRVAFITKVEGTTEPVIQIHDANSGALLKSLDLPKDGAPIKALAFSPTGAHLAATQVPEVAVVSGAVPSRLPPGRLTLWDTATGTQLWDAIITDNAVAPAFSADGQTVTGGGSSQAIQVCRVTDGSLVREYSLPKTRALKHTGDPRVPVQNLAFSTDGSRLVAAGYKGIAFWDVATGQLVHTLPTICERASFSSDSRRLFVSCPQQVIMYDCGPVAVRK